MIGIRKYRRRLRDYVLLSWIGPGVLAIVASLIVFVLLGWLDYQNSKERLASDLEQKSIIAARRASAEIILAENGSLEPVLQLLKQQLTLDSIQIVSDQATCGAPKEESCYHLRAGKIEFYRKVPHTDTGAYIALGQPLRPLWSFLNLFLLMWSAIPIFLALVTGLILQRMFLRRFVIEPINSLVNAAERRSNIPDHWPDELKEIARSLAESFDAREQAVFAMLAKGVVHDIRTFLHSLLTATELVKEKQNDLEKRSERLEALYRASATNLPKMKRIIELTLDGSREIPIHSASNNLSQTIEGAIDANRDQAKNKGVNIDFRLRGEKIDVPHDPVQLERALANLIRNGIDAIPVSIESEAVREVRVSVLRTDERLVQVCVEDSGPGLPADIEPLFKPTRSTKANGAGLGLYITGKIVRGHGGYIQAGQSKDLGGANFVFGLPKRFQGDGVIYD
ncbi:MAG: HAMP domain-containing sensor histidine kinase [Pseudomonadota bacterium]